MTSAMTLIVGLALLTTGFLAISPTASADTCEVPGCQVAGAAVCLVYNSGTIVKHHKSATDVVVDCLTVTH